MSIESYDGLCGIIHLYSSSDRRVRCKHEFGHSGPHSWEKVAVGLHIQAGCYASDFPTSISIPSGERKKVVIGH
jgi:hypothetical protein